MFLYGREKYYVKVRDDSCEVSGKHININHVILLRPPKLKFSISEDGIDFNAEYNEPPNVHTYGTYVVISTSGSRIPVWRDLKGEVKVIEPDKKFVVEGEGGIRLSVSKYLRVDIIGRNEVIHTFASRASGELSNAEFVNILGGQYRSVFVKTCETGKTVIEKTDDTIRFKGVKE